MTQTIARLHQARARFAAAELLADAIGDRAEAHANRSRILDTDRRLREAEDHTRHARDAAQWLENIARRKGKGDAIALMCKRGQLSMIHGRAALALRDVWEAEETGRSPMASMDAIGGGIACNGLEPLADKAFRRRAAMAAAFEWIDRPRQCRAVQLVILRGWALRRAADASGVANSATGLRQIREHVADALDRAAAYFQIAA